jgi:hypothetical protein
LIPFLPPILKALWSGVLDVPLERGLAKLQQHRMRLVRRERAAF